jgi:hypothetical protein
MSCSKILEHTARLLPSQEKTNGPENEQLTSISKSEALTGGAENSVAKKFFGCIEGGEALVEKIRPAGSGH